MLLRRLFLLIDQLSIGVVQIGISTLLARLEIAIKPIIINDTRGLSTLHASVALLLPLVYSAQEGFGIPWWLSLGFLTLTLLL